MPLDSRPFPPVEETLYADVIVPRHLTRPFTYMVPSHLRTVLRIGHVVSVPFGRSLIHGAVIGVTGHHPAGLDRQRLKPIRALITTGRAAEISPALLELARWVADAYIAPFGQCLRLVLPPRSKLADPSRILQTRKGQDILTEKELPSLDYRWCADHQEEMCVLQKVAYFQNWMASVEQALSKGEGSRVLIEASPLERLALLRRAVDRTIALGRKALVITSETARAESLSLALSNSQTVTACLHSSIPDEEKAEIWNRICEDQISLVVGTRSAVFLPLRSIGLIWIDREEDPALKEPMEPRYHVREVAWIRARAEQALLVLASAHLSLEVTAQASDALLRAPVQPNAGPQIEVVDLRRQDRACLLSPRLVQAMREAIARQAGVLLFLNRKAYAGALICRDCGQVPRCRECTVALAYSRQKGSLFCHYCATADAIPDLCSACGGSQLQPIGEGTERVEEEVKRQFPSARIVRVDGETMRRPKEAAAIWSRIDRREWDVLIGTQILLRGDVVPRVGLVGVVQADAGLSLPDFRAAERTYHLLLDASGLGKPHRNGGRLIIQSYLPTHHVIEAVVQRDEGIFRTEELAHRAALGFPPLLRLIALHISGSSETSVEQAARDWAVRLRGQDAQSAGVSSQTSRAARVIDQSNGLMVLGPVRSPVARVRGRYRRQILVKSHDWAHAVAAVRSTLIDLEASYPRRQVKFDVDVDPIEMW